MSHMMELELQEHRLGALARQTLDASCRDLSPEITARLSKGIQQALAHQKQTSGWLHMFNGSTLSMVGVMRPARTVLALLAMVAGMMGSYYWNSYQNAEDNIDVDTALLSDELPMDAYTDQGFRAWLEHNNSSAE